MRLSHSAKETYLTCPKKWELHYKQRLRSKFIGSALFFGAAIDEALNRLLLDKKKTKFTKEDKLLLKLSPEETFIKHFTNVYVQDKTIDISKSNQAMYYKSDLDLSLIQSKDYSKIFLFADSLDITLNNFLEISEFVEEAQKLMKKGLDNSTQRLYNYITWLSLCEKGLLLINTYKNQIMPQIEEVFEVQKRIVLPDGEDEFVGVIDLICSFYDEPGVKYICDNKTSSQPYKQDSVCLSSQLAGYSEYEENDNCAYIVLEKKIRKREPKTRTSIIKDKMPKEMVDKTFETLTEVFHKISEENFEKNLDACYQYGRKCPYYNYCRTNDLTNLKYLKKK